MTYHDDALCTRALAAAVLLLAVEDTLAGDDDARRWLRGPDARGWARMAGLETFTGRVPAMVDTAGAVEILGLTNDSVNRRFRAGAPPAIKVGRAWYAPRRSVMALASSGSLRKKVHREPTGEARSG